MLKMRKTFERKRAVGDVLYLVIPAYNEEANILDTIDMWYPVVERCGGDGRSRLLVINDGSRDRTAEILSECEKTHPLLLSVTQENAGHGAAVQNGYRYALESGADYIFQTDSDGQTLSSEFDVFWENRARYDFQFGVRAHRKDGAGRILTTRVLRFVLKRIFRVRAEDANVPYRLMSAESLRELLPLVPEGYHLTNVFVSILYLRSGKRVNSYPITFRPRQGGKNSINWKRILSIGKKALGEFRAFDRTMREAGI